VERLHLSNILDFIWTWTQARNQGGRKNFFAPLEKRVGHCLKLLDMVQKMWAHLRKVFAPPGVPSWLQACLDFTFEKYFRLWLDLD